MAAHSSILAWEIPWTEEPGWLPGGMQSWTELSDYTITTSPRANMSPVIRVICENF